MQIRWSAEAEADPAHIFAYIEQDNVQAAGRVVQTLVQGARSSSALPRRGRDGKTRELTFAPLPYVLIYEVTDDSVEVLRVLHGAQRRP